MNDVSKILRESWLKLPTESTNVKERNEMVRKVRTPVRQTLRIAAYIRVSSQRQVTEGDSLEAQKNAVQRELDRRKDDPGWASPELTFYVDAGKSAKNQNRPELQRLKSDITNGLVDVVICWKLDRITRSILDFAELWELFQTHDVEFLSLQERFDTSNAMGKAMLMIIMVFAQLERELTGERTRATMEDRASRGLWNGGHVLGYVSDPAEKGRLLVDPEWAEKIRSHFFEALVQVGSIGKIRDMLQKLGVRKPKSKSRAGTVRDERPFTKQQVRDILRNRIYLGEISWGGTVKEAAHEPIVDSALFTRVQEILNRNRITRTNERAPVAHVYRLQGLIRCGNCDAFMTPRHSTGRNGSHFYYSCTRQNHLGSNCCRTPYLPAKAVEDAVLDRLIALSGDDPARERIVAQALNDFDDEFRRLNEQAESIRRRLREIQANLRNMLDVLKSLGSQGLASVSEEIRRLENERTELQSSLQCIESEYQKANVLTAYGREFIENWRSAGQLLQQATEAEQKELLPHLIARIEFRAVDNASRQNRGNYVMTLLPNSGVQNGENRPRNTKSTGAPLTEADPVLLVDEKAPRLGLEPRT